MIQILQKKEKLFYKILLMNIIIIIFILYKIYENYLYNKYKICYKYLLKNNKIQPIFNNKKILNYSLDSFFINSSHNTYISHFQNFSIINTDIIKYILNIGVRAIELDIRSYNDIPIVAHGSNLIRTI